MERRLLFSTSPVAQTIDVSKNTYNAVAGQIVPPIVAHYAQLPNRFVSTYNQSMVFSVYGDGALPVAHKVVPVHGGIGILAGVRLNKSASYSVQVASVGSPDITGGFLIDVLGARPVKMNVDTIIPASFGVGGSDLSISLADKFGNVTDRAKQAILKIVQRGRRATAYFSTIDFDGSKLPYVITSKSGRSTSAFFGFGKTQVVLNNGDNSVAASVTLDCSVPGIKPILVDVIPR